jgi:hypothetical protein
VLEEFESVTRDTARNLRMIDLCQRYAVEELDRELPEAQRAYVTMMHARSRAYRALQTKSYEAAISIIDSGLEAIRLIAVPDEADESADNRAELRVLSELRNEALRQMPSDSPARLRWELAAAVAAEDYARAAKLRDRLSEVEVDSKAHS